MWEISIDKGGEDHIDTDPDDIEYLSGIPRQCKHCGAWARHERPEDRNQRCFTVECPSCYREFEIVIGMKGGRK